MRITVILTSKCSYNQTYFYVTYQVLPSQPLSLGNTSVKYCTKQTSVWSTEHKTKNLKSTQNQIIGYMLKRSINVFKICWHLHIFKICIYLAMFIQSRHPSLQVTTPEIEVLRRSSWRELWRGFRLTLLGKKHRKHKLSEADRRFLVR